MVIVLERFFQKCSSDSHCRARAAKLERVSTLQGVRVIEAIDACECSSESSCRRESYIHHVHSGTPNQAVVDVGVCIGHCGKGITSQELPRAVINVARVIFSDSYFNWQDILKQKKIVYSSPFIYHIRFYLRNF